MKKTEKIPAVLAVTAGVCWGFMGIFARELNQAGLFALEVAQCRITLAMLLMFLYLAVLDREKLKVRCKDLWCFFGTGICSLLCFCWCYFTGLQIESIAVIEVLVYTSPAIIMLLNALLFKESLTRKKVSAMVLTVLGCAFVSGIGADAHVSGRGLLLGLGAGFTYSLYSVFSRFAMRRGYHPWTITFYTFLFCSVGCAFLSDWELLANTFRTDASVWIWALAIAVISGFVPYLCFTLSMQNMESGKASILSSVEPVVGAVLGAALYQEHLTVMQIFGGLLVLSAIVLLNVKQTAHSPVVQRQKRP